MRFIHFLSSFLLICVGNSLLVLFLYMRSVGSVAVIEENIWVWGLEVVLWMGCIIIGVLSSVNLIYDRWEKK